MAFDSLYCAYIKAHYPLEFYETILNFTIVDGKKDIPKMTKIKNEAFNYAGIVIKDMRFGQDNTSFIANKDNSITQSLAGVKTLNNKIAENLRDLKDFKFDSFYDIYLKLSELGLDKSNITNLLKIDYFKDIVDKSRGLWLADNYANLKGRKTMSKDKLVEVAVDLEIKNVMDLYNILKDKCIKETAKQFSFNEGDILKILFDLVPEKQIPKLQSVYWQIDVIGGVIEDSTDIIVGIVDKHDKAKNKINFRDVVTNEVSRFYLPKNNDIVEGNVIFIENYEVKNGKYPYKVINKYDNLTNIYKKVDKK